MDCRRRWDAEQRGEAARLDRVEPAWMVLYGVGRRRFYAFAQWMAEDPLIVEAPTAEGLREQMREAETPRPITTTQAWAARHTRYDTSYEGKAA